VVSTVEAIKEDPLKFAVGLAVGIAVTAAAAAICAGTAGVGCVVIAGAIAGAAAAGAEYGVDVAQGDKEFSWSDLGTEMAIGGAIGAAGAGIGLAAGKAVNAARGAVGRSGQTAGAGGGLADDAAAAGRHPPRSGCLSFDPRTPVLLATGVAVPIGTVQLGDHVLATDPISGVTTAEPVVTLFANTDIDMADVTIVDADGTTAVVHTTQNHPFWNATTHAWTPAADLRPGDHLLTPSGDTVTVAGVITWIESKLMLNLGVSDLHTYYVVVGGAPVLVHNRAIEGGGGIRPYEFGSFNDMQRRQLPRDGLQLHHVPQGYPAGQVIKNYDYRTGLVVALPDAEHRQIKNLKGTYAGTPEELLTRDLQNLKDSTNIPARTLTALKKEAQTRYDIGACRLRRS
jgi:hypothetical protein